MSDAELVQLVKQGEIPPHTELSSRHKTRGHWLPAGRMGFLLKLYEPLPAPPPRPPNEILPLAPLPSKSHSQA